ncbi:MAG: transporter substrate-binding domain-containing protein [Pseudomonadota bacterium]
MRPAGVAALATLFVFALTQSAASDETTVRVGTAGDYQPLTWYDPATGAFSGLAIDMVEDFAEDQGLTIEFVQTSWPTLMDDLLAGDFDMAVGGISWTQQRADQALTSAPVRSSGKVALVRCGEEELYDSLSAIDRQDVTVVENRGGTNERFALSQIDHATLIIVLDNARPPEYLLAGEADVFFTDSIEAVYIEGLGQGLCAVNPDHPYTHDDKVFLFAEGEVDLRDAFDRWFAHRSSDGD